MTLDKLIPILFIPCTLSSQEVPDDTYVKPPNIPKYYQHVDLQQSRLDKYKEYIISFPEESIKELNNFTNTVDTFYSNRIKSYLIIECMER